MRFWTKIIIWTHKQAREIVIWKDTEFIEFRVNLNLEIENIKLLINSNQDWEWFKKEDIKEIIWNPLEERHLRMYTRTNILISFEFISDNNRNIICFIDNTKSFDNQSEEVYEKIYNYLNNI